VVILGIDYGQRRIGVAVSDPLEIAAHGLDTIQVEGTGGELDRIAELVAERHVQLIVVGMPVSMNGTIGPQARKVRGFIKRLRRRLPRVPIETIDERLTSAQAHRSLSEQAASIRERAERVDRVSAQLILTRYLKRRAAGRGADQGRAHQ